MEWIIVFPLFHQRFCPRIENCVMVPGIQGGHPNCTPREQTSRNPCLVGLDLHSKLKGKRIAIDTIHRFCVPSKTE
jgi:hypothetical protein